MRPSALLDQHRAAIRAVVAAHRGQNPRIFGSVLHGEDTDNSDLDLLIEPAEGMALFDVGAIRSEVARSPRRSKSTLSPRAPFQTASGMKSWRPLKPVSERDPRWWNCRSGGSRSQTPSKSGLREPMRTKTVASCASTTIPYVWLQTWNISSRLTREYEVTRPACPKQTSCNRRSPRMRLFETWRYRRGLSQCSASLPGIRRTSCGNTLAITL